MTKPEKSARDLAGEAGAFDAQIRERMAHGHVPDLRRAGRCEWFRNNVWRDPVYVDLVYGAIARRILDVAGEPRRILEIGCGPGHIALELARHGHDVTGIDISAEAIRVAGETAGADPLAGERGPLRYLVSSLEDFRDPDGYDLAVFVGALHHFPDVPGALARVRGLLRPSGRLFVSEPSRRRVTRREAVLAHLVRTLLAEGGMYHQGGLAEGWEARLEADIHAVGCELEYRDAGGGSPQSPHDNESDFDDITEHVAKGFDITDLGDDYGLTDRIIGGLRIEDRAREHRMARWLSAMDAMLVESGAASPRWRHLTAMPKTAG
ncbi:class I SAM-dependent methyltransferase [Pseudodesulfovibrio sp.]|uniref:class I SAM-dependent methyltransferase n=1 Tax=Pseudodesulfovibrio sp. TaxID=2035812 RepID=UPI00263419C7|nr:class I SAM-dependent methyltransferase [Pseudodesulfovibrio sp.]MDD3312396.1 class I SAM-dependent methyltransferase [Pseudodesulfovibrio sp.]